MRAVSEWSDTHPERRMAWVRMVVRIGDELHLIRHGYCEPFIDILTLQDTSGVFKEEVTRGDGRMVTEKVPS